MSLSEIEATHHRGRYVHTRAFRNASRSWDSWDAQEFSDALFSESDAGLKAWHDYLFTRTLEEGPGSTAANTLRAVGAEIDRRIARRAEALYRAESAQIAFTEEGETL
jgi:hypothetical protein